MTKFGYPPSTTPSRDGSRAGATPGPNTPRAVPVQKKSERDKKWALRGWEIDDTDQDDGIVGWMKRKTNMETKSGKKRSACLDTDFYIPTKHTCTSLDDAELFQQQSLHSCFDSKSNQLKKSAPAKPSINFSYTKGAQVHGTRGKPQGVVTTENVRSNPASERRDEDPVKHEIDVYRISKGMDLDKRGKYVNNDNKMKIDQRNTYQKIRRLLKFSSNDRRQVRSDDEEDEGYASKTSSAETKHDAKVNEESNSELQSLENPHLRTLTKSMTNLFELSSNFAGADNSLQNHYLFRENTKFKFNYTHQPTILQLPDPDMKMANERVHVARRLDTDDSGLTYAKLKRSREFSKCYPQEPELPPPDTLLPVIDHENESLIHSDPVKPMTLVLRKISIQNNEQSIPATSLTPVLWSSKETRSASRNDSAAGSFNSSTPNPPVSRSRLGSAVSRCGSAVSRTSSVMSPTNLTSRSVRRSKTYSNIFAEPTNLCAKNATWTQQISLIERQATSYCIGDLLPAVDKNIYSGKLGYPPFKNADVSRDPAGNGQPSSVEDGQMLLKKGMELLTGSDKPTLGPPPFRPNQSRHPLMRHATTVASTSSTDSAPAPVQPERVKQSTLRASSEKGLRPTQLADKESQRKLKEAFTQFYKNRPQDIGREFRRVQTMWKT